MKRIRKWFEGQLFMINPARAMMNDIEDIGRGISQSIERGLTKRTNVIGYDEMGYPLRLVRRYNGEWDWLDTKELADDISMKFIGGEEMSNTVKKEQIDSLIEQSEIEVKTLFDKVTVVAVKLPNGFVLVESSGAVDKQNYDFEIGKKVCIERIENKLWELEGYVLQNKLN